MVVRPRKNRSTPSIGLGRDGHNEVDAGADDDDDYDGLMSLGYAMTHRVAMVREQHKKNCGTGIILTLTTCEKIPFMLYRITF